MESAGPWRAEARARDARRVIQLPYTTESAGSWRADALARDARRMSLLSIPGRAAVGAHAPPAASAVLARGPVSLAIEAPRTSRDAVMPPSAGMGPPEGGLAVMAHSWITGRLTPLQRRNVAQAYPPSAAVAILGAGALLDDVMTAAYAASTHDTMARETLNYEAFCTLARLVPYPVRVTPIMGFLLDRVVRRGLEPSGLTATLSILRKAVEVTRRGWEFDDTDKRMLAWVVRGLAVRYRGQNVRGQKDPLHLGMLVAMVRWAELEAHVVSAADRQLLLQMRLAHAGFLRTGEHCDGHLRVHDVEFLAEEDVARETPAVAPVAGERRVRFAPERRDVVGVRLWVRNAKTGHTTAAPQEVLIGRRVDAADVVMALWDFMTGWGLFEPARQGESLFVALGPDGRRAEQRPTTSAQFRVGVVAWVGRIGAPTAKMSGHSLRRGACNDALDAGVPLEIVMKAGRWKSMAWMGYRRLTAAAMRMIAAVQPQKGVTAVTGSGLSLLLCLKAGSGG